MGEKRSEISKRLPLEHVVSFADASANVQDSKTTFESIKNEPSLSAEAEKLAEINAH